MKRKTARKPRSDCLLKNLPANKQEAIADYGLTHSVTATRDWIVEKYKLRPGRTAVGEFLSWSKTIDQRCQNRGAVHALASRLESDEPDLTPEELERLAKKHFAETVIEKSDLMAWHRAQRIAIRQEEVRLQGEELKLKRQMFECATAEWTVKTFTNPKLKSIAQNGKKTYVERIVETQSLMFGEEPQGVESLNGGTVESGQGVEANIQSRTPGLKMQHPIPHGAGNIEHQEKGSEAPISKLQAPENNQTSSINEIAGETPALPGPENSQPSTNTEAPTPKLQAPDNGSTPHPNPLPDRGGEGGEPSTCNVQPSTKSPQLSPAAGSMSPTDALNFAENLRTKVKQICLAIINHWDVAALTACLSGQPAKWYSTRIGDHEIMPPPPVDPRLDPESPWFNAWKEYVKGELL